MSTTKPAADSPLLDVTAFQRDIMAIIAKLQEEDTERECYGLAIKEELEKYYGEVNHGRLYPNLDDLVAQGLIKKGMVDRRTNSYDLTERGRRELESDAEWRNEHV